MQVLPAQLHYIPSMMQDAALKHVSVYQIDGMVSPADTCTKIEHIGSTRWTWISRLFASLINETDVPAALLSAATWTCLITLLCIWMHTISYVLYALGSFPDIIPCRPRKCRTKQTMKSCWVIHVKNSPRGSKAYGSSVVYLDLQKCPVASVFQAFFQMLNPRSWTLPNGNM